MKTKMFKSMAIVVAVNIVAELCFPLAAYALTSGPTQPEFTSFEPVATTNMVNEFSGAFTYNLPLIQIPGPNGGNYALSLSYHSGASTEEEASWVGYGWTLNPGAIVRNTRGYPDDYYKANITYFNKTKPNWTMKVGTTLGVEAFSKDQTQLMGSGYSLGGLSGNYQLILNSYRGYGYVAGFNVKALGLASFGYQWANGKRTFTYSINPAGFLMNLINGTASHNSTIPANQDTRSWSERMVGALKGQAEGMAAGAADQLFNFYAVHSYQDNQRPVNVAKYEGSSFNVTAGLQYTGIPFVGLQGQLSGNYSVQENVDTQQIPAWGYMYSGMVTTANVMMDYYVEKDVPYTMRDKFLAIPFSNADNYMLTGEGLGGGFRLHNAKPGHFRKNSVSSKIDILQVGVEGSVGTSVGVGADFGTGSQRLQVKEWTEYNSLYKFAATSTSNTCEATIDEPYFFRFNNDMGGKITYDNSVWEASDDGPRRGRDVRPEINPVVNAGTRSARSSYIGYHTNSEMPSKAYARDPRLDDHINRAGTETKEGVGEFAVYNEQGNRYVYGLPVYSMKEQTLQYGNRVKSGDPLLVPDANQYRASYSTSKVLNVPTSATFVVGEERNQPYATSYLLTEITTPDYCDLTHNGPSPDDFGGYVRFAYERRYGSLTKSTSSSASFYKWRVPYSGMLYQRNELSEPDDNTGSVMNGYKEVYYLDTIETKTHYAVFVKSDRLDGLGAVTSESTALKSLTAKGSQKLKKLDKIKLYAKGADGVADETDKLLYTVCLEYENSLCRNLPNTSGTGSTSGKLTLKKVWFEYEGVKDIRITPYVFGYEYRKSTYYSDILSSDLMAKYNNIVTFGNGWTSADQNPDYNPCNIDAWGSYQKNGTTRYQKMQSWVNQNPPGGFDPAAWQLKWIHLPTGGEIQIHYEQNDYSYVQDRRALTMVQLSSLPGDNTPEGDKFFLNIAASLGGSVSPQDVADLIQTQFVNTQEEMYFKILYSLYDPNTMPTFTNAEITPGTKKGAEYITGYSRVKETGVGANGKVYVVLEHRPRQVGLELVEAHKAGREERTDFFDVNGSNVFGKVIDFMSNFGRTFYDEETTCKNVNWNESYLRIPTPQPKKGGGIRVKRLLMVDPGLDGTASGAVYGSEYDYSMEDEHTGKKISSGVAANEPGAIREENALVVSLKKRFDQTAYQRATAGVDKEQFEGPIGESVLPGASVGYAKVTVKNIHDGVTGNGFSVHEFFTARDYPFDRYYRHANKNGVSWTDMWMEKSRSMLPLVVVNNTKEDIIAEQGFSFIINSMHGQMKRVSTYGGTYNDESTWVLSSMQEYSYFEPGEAVPMFNGPDRPLRYDTPGKEMEVVFEGRHIIDRTNNFSLEADVQFIVAAPAPLTFFPIVTGFLSFSKNESILRTHVTTKVVRYPAIQKSVLSYRDGIYHLTENIAFHPATGKPLIVRTTDGFDKLVLYDNQNNQNEHNGAYHAYNFPAEQDYVNMGQKSLNERAWIYSSTATHTIAKSNMTLSFTGNPEFIEHTLTNCLFTGDLIELNFSPGKRKFYVAGISIGTGTGTVTLEHYDSGITAINGNVVKIEVIRSGRTNNLAAMAGNVTTYGEGGKILPNTHNYINELAKRQRIVNLLNNSLLRGQSEQLTTTNTFGVKFRMDEIYPMDETYPDNVRVATIDEQYAIGIRVSCDEIKVAPKRVVCGTSADPSDFVVALNNTLDELWGTTITTATTPFTSCYTIAVNDYQYPANHVDIVWMQQNVVRQYGPILSSSVNGCAPWYLAGDLGKMTVSMTPSTPPGYYDRSNKVTGLKRPVEPDPKLTSLQIKYGNNYLLRCYVTTGTCQQQYKWGFLPDMDESVFADFSGTSTATAQVHAVLTGNGSFTTRIGKFGQTDNGILFFDCFLTNKRHYYGLRLARHAADNAVPSSYPGNETTIIKSPLGPGRFALTDDGQIVYYKSGSSTPVSFPCMNMPIDIEGAPARKDAGPDITRVVAASAQTYDDNWPFSTAEHAVPAGVGQYQRGARGKWRPKSTYGYKTDIIAATNASLRIYNGGIYTDFTLFDKTSPDQKWMELNRVTKYSPHGEAVEERDILGILSSARFGYKNTVPVVVAKNAAYTAVSFTSFEDQPVGGEVISTNAHSGVRAYALGPTAIYTSTTLTLDARLKEQGLQVKFWVRTPGFVPLDGSFLVQLDQSGTPTEFSAPAKIAQTGEWTLYEAVCPATSLAPLSDGNFTVKLQGGNDAVEIDDIRIQPLDAQTMAYVYDENLRVIAIMDDQHFGLYYQYNAEGKLVRKLKETERGMKTIAETQYHTPSVSRDQTFAMVSAPPSSPQWFAPFRENMPVDRDKTLLQQLLENQDSGAGGKFDFEKRLTVPNNYMKHLQQQVDSVNERTRTIRPRRPQAPAGDSATGKKSSNSRK